MLFWGVVIFYILNNSLKSTAIDSPSWTKNFIHNFFPEGWGFFTRNPREESVNFIFIRKNDQALELGMNPCSSGEYAFGLNRDCRAKSAELDILIKQVPDSLWTTKRSVLNYQLIQKTPILDTIINYFHVPEIEGEVALIKQERLPWAWSKNHRTLNAPLSYVKVYVEKH